MIKDKRERRHYRLRRKLTGVSERPRLAVYRSGQHIYAQIIDDTKGATLASESDLKLKEGTKKDKALTVGENLAKKALKLKVTQIVFDRGGFKYHGRVASLAEGLRKGGLQF